MNKNLKFRNIISGMLVCLLILPVLTSAQATVIMTFDDGWISVCCGTNTAYSIMQGNNQNGVAFVNIAPLIGAGYTDYMKQTELNTLYGTGWDISSHTYNHVNLTPTNDSVRNFELNESKQWLDTNGYPRGSMFLAYPEGSYDDALLATVNARHYMAARTVEVPNGSYPHYTLGGTDIYKMKVFETVGGLDNTSTVIQQLENANASNGLIILVFHKLVTGNPTNETEFSISDFQNVSNYIKNSNFEVTTFSKYFLINISEPPTPITASIVAGFNWALYSWAPGLGTYTTNLYYVYVNGLRISETADTSINISRISGVNDNVSVFAVNVAPNGLHSVSKNALIMPPIPVWIPPTPINIAYNYTMGTQNGTKNGSILIYWQNGTGNITNNFNVKVGGIWVINGTTNLSYNITEAVPGVIYPIEVFAVNTSNDITINATSAKLSAIIPLFRPPVPIWKNMTYGNFWTLFEWNSGTGGNHTDLFNYSVKVNNITGNWTLANDTSVNVTTLPHADIVISIYAVNNTNGGSQSISYLYMNMTMPNNPVDVFNGIWADYDIYAGDILRIQPVFRNLDNDTVIFEANTPNATGNVSINKSTGEFIYNSTNSDIGKKYHWSITAYDNLSEPETVNFNVSIIAIPSPYSGMANNGGNGGGAVSVYDPNAYLYERRDSQIRSNVTSVVQFTKNKLVSNVTFFGNRNYGEVTVKVSLLRGNPTPYYICDGCTFFSISLDNIKPQNEYLYISNKTTITLNIDKSNLSDNSTFRLYKFYNDSWQPLIVEDTNIEFNNSKIFKAETYGFSTFVIMFEPKVEEELKASILPIEESKSSIESFVDQQVAKAKESLYRMIINLIKKYMWWI